MVLKKNEEALIAFLFVIINFLVKGSFLAFNSLANDEPFSVYHAQMDVVSIIKLLSEGNNPPLFEILLHFWIKIFGISEFSVRFPSLLFSCITVLYIFKLGTKYLNVRIAVYSSFIFIFSNYHILFAHEARAYSLLGMLSCMSMYYFLKLVNQDDSNSSRSICGIRNIVTKQLLILTIVNALIIYTQYFGFFILLTQFLFVALNKDIFLRCRNQLLIIIFMLILMYSPNIYIFFHRFLESSIHGTWVQKPNGIYSIIDILRLFSNNEFGENVFKVSSDNFVIQIILKAPVTLFSIILIGISIIRIILFRNFKHLLLSYKLVLLWFFFPFIFMFIISYFIPMFLGRYLMPAAIAYCFLLGLCADFLLQQSKFRYVIPVIVCLLFLATVKPNLMNKRNVREAIEKIKDIRNSNTLVLICPSHFVCNFSYYYNKNYFKNLEGFNNNLNLYKDLKSDNIYGINNIAEIDYKNWDHIVFLDAAADFSFPNNNINKELLKNFVLKKHYYFYEIFNIYEYSSEYPE
jgi:uncharacterized membrane protein